jgi:hypothetical protein
MNNEDLTFETLSSFQASNFLANIKITPPKLEAKRSPLSSSASSIYQALWILKRLNGNPKNLTDSVGWISFINKMMISFFLIARSLNMKMK